MRTDEAYFLVGWYVNGVWKTTSLGSDSTTEAYFSPDPLSGSLSGTTYEIKAVAQPWNEGTENDSDSYTITVYEPKIDSGTGTNTGVWGIAKLSRQYYSHPNITMVGYVYAYNDTGRPYTGFARFKHHVDGPGVHLRTERDKPELSFSGNGGTYGSYPESISHSIENGTSGQRYTSWAYIRLKASGHNANNIAVEDDWFVENSVSFMRQ